MKARDTEIPIAFLQECLAPREDGVLVWKRRPREHFSSQRPWSTWNSRYSGKPAGCPHIKGYIQVVLTWEGRTWHVLGHRLVWAISTGAWPLNEIDHRDGNRTNNHPSNLREATGAEQQHNRGLSKRNTSGLSGVSWNRAARKWIASICAQRRQVHLGLFDRPEDAHAAYLDAKRRLHPFQPEPRA